MLIDDLASAPNPQFARPDWIDLTGLWQFGFDDADAGVRERWFERPELLRERIQIPYPPESRLSGIHDTGYHTRLWYARTFEAPRMRPGDRLRINFGAVDYEATVWIDGSVVGNHSGGHTPFSFDITDALRSRSEHTIVVRVHDDPLDIEQPRGKQDWQASPHGIWYYRTSGIWQSVWLEVVPQNRINSLRWNFDADTWSIRYEVELAHTALEGTLVAIDFEQGDHRFPGVRVAVAGRSIAGSIGLLGSREVMHPEAALWSPERPNLIGAKVTLSAPGASDDVVHSYLGLRTIATTSNRVLLNGRSRFLRLVLEQGYWPESQLVAPTHEALEREVELILALGFNGARIHQKVEDPRFLYWADRKGLMLWGEMPSPFTYSDLGISRHAREWEEVVMRDRNHPSVIAWVPFHESWGVNEIGYSKPQQRAVAAAYHRTHQLDGTRPVIGNDGWEHVEADIFTIHDYTWDADLVRRRYRSAADVVSTIETFFPGNRSLVTPGFQHENKPVIVSEYGGVSFAPAEGEEWYGYGKVRTTAEYVEKYRELTTALTSSDHLSGFCYTQLTDTEQETNGLLDENRVPKAPIEQLREITMS
ncbi:glycoside hydrolase family 2 TIM barrel-domain containing protein [soil metagenome]